MTAIGVLAQRSSTECCARASAIPPSLLLDFWSKSRERGVRKVDGSVELDAGGRVQIRLAKDPDADDVRRRQNASAGVRRPGPDGPEKQNSDANRREQQAYLSRIAPVFRS